MAGTTLNQKVVNWARGKAGQKIGRGECWDLADQALRHAGARSSTTAGDDDDYDWGTPLELKDVRSGDILQFRDYVVTTRTDVEISFPGDSETETSWEEVSVSRPHHTAVVDAVLGHGALKILEQNIEPLGKHVQKHTLYVSEQEKAPRTSHKRMKDASGKMAEAKVRETVTITISGDVWAYRPEVP